jgi:GTP-sensing pleiotropic transcriptional regulator CodY
MMKPGYKIIIAGLLIYGGFRVKAIMDVAPYKERASHFVSLLKQSQPFAAQEMLGTGLQKEISIERITQMIRDQNLSQSSEIQWSDWTENEGNYTLQGALLFSHASQSAIMLSLFPYKENDIRISQVKIGESLLKRQDGKKREFLK